MSDPDLHINGVPIEATFAEAFDMKATRLIVTGDDRQWAREAVDTMIGFGTSVIACGIEMGIERPLHTGETPDGRPGFSVLAFAVSGKELDKQIPRRVGQCVLTCPTASLFAGLQGDRAVFPDRVALGKSVRYFGDGHQISKVTGGRRYWRIPVMDGEFLCEHDVGRTTAVGGGNFLLLAESLRGVTIACRAAVEAIRPLPGVITPFPGGAARSGSKVGSKYPSLFASTNDQFCPTLRHRSNSRLRDDENFALEVVIDGMEFDQISCAIDHGIRAACDAAAHHGLRRVTAGNYGGELGKHHFHLAEILS